MFHMDRRVLIATVGAVLEAPQRRRAPALATLGACGVGDNERYKKRWTPPELVELGRELRRRATDDGHTLLGSGTSRPDLQSPSAVPLAIPDHVEPCAVILLQAVSLEKPLVADTCESVGKDALARHLAVRPRAVVATALGPRKPTVAMHPAVKKRPLVHTAIAPIVLPGTRHATAFPAALVASPNDGFPLDRRSRHDLQALPMPQDTAISALLHVAVINLASILEAPLLH
mmetsp:Transcript_96613/g.273143  ORF Transcript_96613/g.273143 Transcript_96613/m.273143 type:complete len:231 (-) Transcript_96613:129-821(-)